MFAPGSKVKLEVSAGPAAEAAVEPERPRTPSDEKPRATDVGTSGPELRPRRLDWAALLKRVFEVDVLHCGKCGGRRKVTAFIPSGERARETLERLGIVATAPPIAQARAPPEQLEWAY